MEGDDSLRSKALIPSDKDWQVQAFSDKTRQLELLFPSLVHNVMPILSARAVLPSG